MNIPGPLSLGILLGVAIGICVALAIIWPRARTRREKR
jgi:hypothetical protein